MNRRVMAVTILAVWLAAVGWLLKREYLSGDASALFANEPLNVSPTATYYRLVLGGQHIGFASSLVDTLPDAVRVQDLMVLDIPALGTIQRVEARTVAQLSRSLRLRTFTATLRGSQAQFAARGAVSGDTLLTLEIQTAGTTQTSEVRLSRPIVLPSLLPLRVAFGGEVEVGQTYTVPMFDPVLLQTREVTVAVTAESTMVVVDSAAITPDSLWEPARWDTVRAWRVTQRTGGLEMEAWIDDLGRIVSASTPVGFRMERTAFEIAYLNFGLRRPEARTAGLGGADLIRQTAIAAAGPGATAAVRDLEGGTLAELRVRLGGVALDGFDLSGGRQLLAGDTLIVRREEASRLEASYRLPAILPEIEEYLRSEPLIQVNDPRIQAQARTIVGRMRNPARAARAINEWVYEALDKQVTVSVPSAVDVLETRRGDCNEHTVLFVALARAAGIPTRTAAGLMLVSDRFYYHAWPEVWMGEEWVAVDPTFNQFPADAAHLRFTVGGLVRQVELIRLIGQLTIDVVDSQRTP